MYQKLFYSTIILLLSILYSAGQNACNCEAFIDYQFQGYVHIYNKPFGNILDSISNDSASQDVLILVIYKSNSGFYKVEIQRSISTIKKVGWIEKKNYIGIYARNYADGTILNLYTEPDKKSKVNCRIKEWIPEMYTIIDCKKDWIKVRLKYKNRIYSGWLEKEMQCANPYSTCS